MFKKPVSNYGAIPSSKKQQEIQQVHLDHEHNELLNNLTNQLAQLIKLHFQETSSSLDTREKNLQRHVSWIQTMFTHHKLALETHELENLFTQCEKKLTKSEKKFLVEIKSEILKHTVEALTKAFIL